MQLKKLASCAILALATGAASHAFAHAQLQASEPKAGAVLAQAPKQLRVQFDIDVEPLFTKIKLVDAKLGDVELPRATPEKDSAKAFHVALPPLKSGDYRVRWTTVTRDGHKMSGEFPFKVK